MTELKAIDYRVGYREDIPSEVTYKEMVVIKDMLDFIASH